MSLSKGTCKLCLLEKSLLNKSHIIPDFMYGALFDKHHKMNKFAPADYVKGNKKVQRPSSGEYEGKLLCAECDNKIIGQYEAYGKRTLFAGVNESSEDPVCENGVTEFGMQVTRFSNVDYKKFKIFLLSILWRASISRRDFFSEVKLGSYEESLRLMIHTGEPGETHVFPVLLYSWFRTKFVDFVSEPSRNRSDRGIRYSFPIGGITYLFHVSPESFAEHLLPFTILSSGVFTILHIPPERGEEFFRNIHGIR